METAVLVTEERNHPREASVPPVCQQLLVLKVAKQRLVIDYMLANGLEHNLRLPKQSLEEFH